jgi:putative salt-induced outer membrane protein YdiY
MTYLSNAKPLLGAVCAVLALGAEEAPKLGLVDKASLSFVSVGGNAQSQSMGFGNDFKYVWSDSIFAFGLGGMRVNTTTTTRTASGPSLPDATVVETSTTGTSAQNYHAEARYDRNLAKRIFWYVEMGWVRNTFSGFDNRYTGSGGAGYAWLNQDRLRFRTDLGLGFLKEDPVFVQAGREESYATWNFTAKVDVKFFKGSAFGSELLFSDRLRDSQDYLAVWHNALTSALNGNLALKVGYDVTYKNHPGSVGVDVVQTPVAAPPVILGQVPALLKKMDTAFTTSLVITF